MSSFSSPGCQSVGICSLFDPKYALTPIICMGLRTDVLALVSMLIGLAGAVILITVSSRTEQSLPPAR